MRKLLLSPLLAMAVALALALAAAGADAASWNAINLPLGGLSPAASPFSPFEQVVADSCPASGFCVAVGGYSDANSSRQGLIETLHGSSLTATTAPVTGLNPAAAVNPNISLIRVACGATGSCVAIGQYTDTNSKTHSFAEVLSGGTWTAKTLPLTGLSPAPDPASARTFLTAITCPAAGACVAVGTYEDSSTPQLPLTERLSGTAWTARTGPVSGLSPAGTQGSLSDVSCSHTGSCIAVGGTDGGDGDLVETLAAGAWTGSTPDFSHVKPAPVRAVTTHQLAGSLSNDSCSSSGTCEAVGTYTDERTNGTQGLILSLGSGGAGASSVDLAGLTPPKFSNPFVQFGGVDCRAGCTSVAAYTGSGGQARDNVISTADSTFVSSFSGLTPGIVHPPTFPFQSLSCPSAARCVAAGQYVAANGDIEGGIELISPTASSATTPSLKALSPVPASNPDSSFFFVSCPASGPCLATGNYVDSGQTVHGMLGYSGPVVSKLTPPTGPVAGGNTVTILGSGFAAGTTVSFGSVASPSVTFVSPTVLKAIAPAGTLGLVDVTVTSPALGSGLATASDTYTYEPPPTVTSVSPGSGPTIGGGTITVFGTGFIPTATVHFATTTAGSVAFISANEMQATIPPHAAGTVRVWVRTANGSSGTTQADRFIYRG